MGREVSPLAASVIVEDRVSRQCHKFPRLDSPTSSYPQIPRCERVRRCRCFPKCAALPSVALVGQQAQGRMTEWRVCVRGRGEDGAGDRGEGGIVADGRYHQL